MTLDEYREFVLSRWCLDPRTHKQAATTHARLMLLSEVGELAALWQKSYQGHGVPSDACILDELGDVLFCVVALDLADGRNLSSWEQHSSSVHPTAPQPVASDPAAWLFELQVMSQRALPPTWSAHGALVQLARICRWLGWADHPMNPLEILAGVNVAKLTARYPEGFEPSRSVNRGEHDYRLEQAYGRRGGGEGAIPGADQRGHGRHPCNLPWAHRGRGDRA